MKLMQEVLQFLRAVLAVSEGRTSSYLRRKAGATGAAKLRGKVRW